MINYVHISIVPLIQERREPERRATTGLVSGLTQTDPEWCEAPRTEEGLIIQPSI